MQNWEIFEQNATTFLQNIFNNYKFKNTGSSNANTPDIEVHTKNNVHLFNIEAKYSPSQAGQIVIIDNNGHFEFSLKSKNPRVVSTDILISHINSNYDKYAQVSQSSIPIDIHTDILYDFIEEQYEIKANKWIIASNNKSNLTNDTMCLIPTEELRQNFDISASLRRKKSGTSEVAKSFREEAKIIIRSLCKNPIFEEQDKKIFLYGDIGTHPHELPNNLYLSKKDTHKYEIRKRSNTNNANIMFSLKLKNTYDFKREQFQNTLNSFH